MSLKMQDITITEHNGKIVICRKNKRNQIKNDFKDITDSLLSCIMNKLSTPSDKLLIYKDKETENFFKIDITAMTSEETKDWQESKKRKSQKSIIPLIGFMGMFLRDRT